MKLSFFFAAAVIASSVALPAQCLFQSVSTKSIGPSCNFGSTGFCAIVSRPTMLDVTMPAGSCSLEMRVDIFEGCGATVPLRAIAFGVQPMNLPLPQFGPECALHLVPILIVPTTSAPLVLNLPLNVASLGFLAQALAVSVPPFEAGYLTFSDGLAIDLH